MNPNADKIGWCDEITKAYFAGLFDGEGSVGVSSHKSKSCKRGNTFELILQLSNTNKSVIEDLKKTFGGSITEINFKNKRTIWKWDIPSRKAMRFLKAILPYLRIKRERAEIAIEFQERKKWGQNLSDEDYDFQKRTREQLMTLNAKGLCAGKEFPKAMAHTVRKVT